MLILCESYCNWDCKNNPTSKKYEAPQKMAPTEPDFKAIDKELNSDIECRIGERLLDDASSAADDLSEMIGDLYDISFRKIDVCESCKYLLHKAMEDIELLRHFLYENEGK